jgi:hypothetical protein
MVLIQLFAPTTPCTGQVGLVATLRVEHFGKRGPEFFLLPIIFHTRPPASNATRWVASE